MCLSLWKVDSKIICWLPGLHNSPNISYIHTILYKSTKNPFYCFGIFESLNYPNPTHQVQGNWFGQPLFSWYNASGVIIIPIIQSAFNLVQHCNILSAVVQRGRVRTGRVQSCGTSPIALLRIYWKVILLLRSLPVQFFEGLKNTRP